jgi:short subunit dehydrogenase-like uncharacterized protein
MEEIEFEMLDAIEVKKDNRKKVKLPVEKAKKPIDKKEEKKEVNWYDLHFCLSEAGDHLVRSLCKREDIPDDAKDILKGILSLRETRDLILAEGGRLTPASAMFWAEELKSWSQA